MINPGSVYEYDLETNETSTLKVREVLGEYMKLIISQKDFG